MTSQHTTLLFVRHGETLSTGEILQGRTPGIGLSHVGLSQAERLAERIKTAEYPLDALYSSPRERTHQTAHPISVEYGLRIQTDSGLDEVDFGDWTNERLEDLRKDPAWDRLQRRPSDFKFPNGESLRYMQSRVTMAINHIISMHPGHTVAVVSHADCIKAMICHVLGMSLEMIQRLTVSPASISGVAASEQGYKLLFFNNLGDSLPDLSRS